MRERGKAWIGTSGYDYRHWDGRFYPEGVARADRFAHYAARFPTVEVNATFYQLPSASTVEAWRERAPPGFCYALKYSRYGTHLKKLKDPEQTLRMFLDRAERLGAALGPILVQLPPRWRPDLPRLERFLEAAPSRHRWALEVRDPRWFCERLYALLEAHDAALVVHDMIEDHPRRRTASWIYHRFHGDHYQGSYSHQALSAEAGRLWQELAAGRDAYVYFNNDACAFAPRNALDLRRYLDNRASGAARSADLRPTSSARSTSP